MLYCVQKVRQKATWVAARKPSVELRRVLLLVLNAATDEVEGLEVEQPNIHSVPLLLVSR